ncbi:VOC family protein [Hoeflea sp. WL0058]|uniref:VOC family protein n=2 Tax=Flavimaribacter sediminis TaxID=2865987 RepID=A0AAE2ZNG5_9HYPH|nr:VOC family protein [Flavimaribacter sediminis]MBW8637951.1 VOC family protein [Flavimaribacter sediminis]
MRAIAHVTFLVPSYDEGIAFFTETLGFDLVEDTPLGGGKRWVLVRPSGGNGASLLVAEATDDAQRAAIGRQTGGRVGFFLHTDDFARDHRQMLDRGVEFIEEPRFEAYGTVAVFRDPFGNSWDLIEPAHT